MVLLRCYRYSSTTMVSFQLNFPVGYTPPSCAPNCLINLGCGEASLDPSLEGYSFSKPADPAVQPNGNYPLTLYVSALALDTRFVLHSCPAPLSDGPLLEAHSEGAPIAMSPVCPAICDQCIGLLEASDVTLFGHSGHQMGRHCMQFPSAAQYPAPGFEPPVITSCVHYSAQPCDSTALTTLGVITFDATRPTLTISKVSEQYGDPTTSTATRKLQQMSSSQPLFALMLFNFSKAGVL